MFLFYIPTSSLVFAIDRKKTRFPPKCVPFFSGLMFQGFHGAPQEGLEPTTLRLTAECSAIELLRQRGGFFIHPIGIRRRPTLPGRVQPSTIGAEGLNFCVRYGNRWDPFAIATGNCSVCGGRGRCAFAHSSYLPKVPFLPLWESSSPLKLSLLPFGLLTLPGCILRYIKFNACYALA